MKNKSFRLAGLFILLILSFLLTSVLTGGQVLADEDLFEISCQADDRHYRSGNGGGYPVIIRVKNNGDDFSGTLKVMLFTGSDENETIAYGQNIEIRAGGYASYHLNVDNILFGEQSYAIPIRVDMLDEGGNTVYKGASYFMAEADGYATICAGIISNDTRISTGMKSSSFDYNSKNDYVMGKVTMQGIDMTPAAMEAMDLSWLQMVVLDKSISGAAWEHISEWLKAGGHLLIARHVYDELIDKPLDDQQMTDWGLGHIYVYEQSDWSGATLIRAVRSVFDEDELYALMNGDMEEYWNIEYLLSLDTVSAVPDIKRYLIILIIYILLMGPAAWKLLKKRDRREYLWAVIPCAAIAFSLIVYGVSSSTRYDNTFMRYASTVWLTDEGNVANNYMAVISPEKGKTALNADASDKLSYQTDDCYWYDVTDADSLSDIQKRLLNADYDVAFAGSGDKTDILIRSRSIFDEKYLKSTRITESNGTIESDITYYCGAFGGTITNTTPWDLHNLFVMHQGVILLLGDLPAGQTLTLDGQHLSQFYTDADIRFDTSDYRDTNEQAGLKLMNNLVRQLSPNIRMRSVIGGFTTDYDMGIENGQPMMMEGLSLVVRDLEIVDSGDDWKTEAVIYGTGETAEDRDGYDSYAHYIYTEELNLNYRLAGDLPVIYLEWLNKSDSLELEFYNYQTERYDAVLRESTSMDGTALAPYLDQDNALKVRATTINYDEERYVPAFTVTGGGQHD